MRLSQTLFATWFLGPITNALPLALAVDPARYGTPMDVSSVIQWWHSVPGISREGWTVRGQKLYV